MTDQPVFTFDEAILQGREGYTQMRFDLAEHGYRRAVELQPDSYEAHLGLARTFARMRHEADARAEAERCIELAPQRFEGHATLGVLHFLTDHSQDAIAALRKAIELAPQDPEPHLTLSQVYADMRQFAQATEERETARELIAAMPDNRQRQELQALAWHVETYQYLAEGNRPKAVAAAQEVLALEDVNPYAACLAYSNLGILEARAGRGHYHQAIEFLEQAFSMNPFFHRAGSALGRLLLITGQPARSAEVLGKVLESMPPDRGSTRYAYALALSRSRRRPEALAQVRQALAEGLRGTDRLMAQWQLIWLSPRGRWIVFGVLALAAVLYVVLAHPSTQTITFLVLVVMLIVLQRTVGQRLR